MPTYDYVCDNCEYAFEKFQSMSAGILRKCPKCGKRKLKRLIGTGGGIIFKGSGFYETDYRSDSYKQGEKSASSDATASTAKPADAKPKKDSSPKTTKTAKPSEK